MKILLTGSTGFIGGSILSSLAANSLYSVVAAVRKDVGVQPAQRTLLLKVGDISLNTDWSLALVGVDVVIHSAARAHASQDDHSASLDTYRAINLDGTMALARKAADMGVKRFIFISSVGVNGNFSTTPFKESDVPAPTEPYAQSKYEAEVALLKLSNELDMDVVIIRPPLVYGYSAPGNFRSLINAVSKSLPLPLGAINNKRSFVAIDNLVDLIITCIDHPAAANQIFLAGDGEDISTTQLLRSVANAMGKPSRLIPIPASWLMMTATVLGKKAVAQRLLGSLQVDISKAQQLLGWTPPISIAEGLRRCFPIVKD